MNFSVKHSLPGRIRIRYNKNEISKRQAALAVSLLSVQDGMLSVNVNYTTGSFLIFYDQKKAFRKAYSIVFYGTFRKIS